MNGKDVSLEVDGEEWGGGFRFDVRQANVYLNA